MRVKHVAVAAILLFLGIPFSAVAQSNWQVKQTFHIGGEGGWDYVTADPQTHRLFVTRSTHTQVIDDLSGKVLGDIPDQVRSHGVALVPKLNRGFITDGGGKGAILVFDLKTYATLGKIAALPDADGIIYDPKTDFVLAVAGDANALIMFHPNIDLKNGKIDTVQLGGAPEFLAADGNGKAYINLEDKDLVAVVDLNARKVIARWPVTPGGHPVGMAIDPASHRLFVGCRNPQKLVVMNAETGKVEAALPIGAGVDATRFADGQAFASCRDGSLTVVATEGDKFAIEQTVKTLPGARTMEIDTGNDQIYLPTSEFEDAVAGGRPKLKPDTFQILVVGK